MLRLLPSLKYWHIGKAISLMVSITISSQGNGVVPMRMIVILAEPRVQTITVSNSEYSVILEQIYSVHSRISSALVVQRISPRWDQWWNSESSQAISNRTERDSDWIPIHIYEVERNPLYQCFFIGLWPHNVSERNLNTISLFWWHLDDDVY